MLKNKIWIVALFAALAIGFIGCTDAAFDWVPPMEQLDDNAIQVFPKETYVGIDLNNAKFNFAVGDKIVVTGKALASNTIHISDNHQSWSPIGATGSQKCAPDEEYEISATLTKANVDSIKAVSPPAIRVYGNTANATYIIYNIVVTRGTDEIFNYYEQILKTLTPGETDINKIFDTEGIGDNPLAETEDKAKHWTSQAANKGTAGTFTILGPGFGGSAAEPTPEYVGDPTKVVFTPGTPALDGTANPADDVVIDYDPSVTGANVTISDKGVVTLNGNGSVVRYKFPTAYITGTGKKATKNPLDLETDYDLIEIDYTISNFGLVSIESTPANPVVFKTKFVQYETGFDGTAYGNITGGNWVGLGGAGPHTLNVQTWGAGGKGGIEIYYNHYDIRGSVDFKIDKVTFTKDDRVTVKFYSPQTNATIASVTVKKGNSIGSKLPAPTNAPWAFLGWYDTWNGSTENSGVTITAAVVGVGNRIADNTAINANMELYAVWLKDKLAAVSTSPVANTTDLFSAVGSYDTAGNGATAASRYTFDDKAYWIVSQGSSQNYDFAGDKLVNFKNDDADDSADELALIKAAQLSYGDPNPGYTRLGFNLSTITAYWNLFKTVTITYDFILLDGDNSNNGRAVEFRNSATAAGGSTIPGDGDPNATPWLNIGDDQTITYTIGNFSSGWISIVNNNATTSKLLRITKIELKP